MAARAGGTPERPALFFDGPEDFRAWLGEHAGTADELWMGLRKKHVRPRGLLWQDAVVEALCHGWIDSQVQRIDEDAVRHRWTPRKPGSTWSTTNIDTAERLIAHGRMTPRGLAAFAARRADRSGIYSYEQEQAQLPPEYAGRLAGDPVADAFWAAASPSYRRIASHWVISAKQAATRERRIAQLVDDCAAGRLIPSQRYGHEPAWVDQARARLGIERLED